MPRTSTVTSNLVQRGYDRYDLFAQWHTDESDPGYQRLLKAFEDLRLDPYAVDSGRYRRYGRAVLIPWSRELIWVPDDLTDDAGTQGYDQGDNNPDYVNVIRRLPSIPKESLDNEFLKRMIWFDFDQTSWSPADREWPVNVGIHFIKLHVDEPGMIAYSSPNELHQDGEPFVFAHLVYRKNAEGGRNVIAPPRWRGAQPEDVPAEDKWADFVMERPMEAYGIKDVAVSHYVGPIRTGSDDGPAERAVVLVDMIPMRQNLILRSDSPGM